MWITDCSSNVYRIHVVRNDIRSPRTTNARFRIHHIHCIVTYHSVPVNFSVLIEMRNQRLPAFLVVLFLHLLAMLQTPSRDPDHETTLEHKGHGTGADLLGFEVCIAGTPVGCSVRSMGAHDVVETCACGSKAAAGLCIVVSCDQTHEL
jgi:hypothetical protein